jgi:hypothetical protein
VEHRTWRRKVLQATCVAAKLRYPNLDTIIGIGTDPHGFVEDSYDDYLLLNPEVWSKEMLSRHEPLVEELGLFRNVSVALYSPSTMSANVLSLNG